MKKKSICIIILMLFSLFIFIGCNKENNETEKEQVLPEATTFMTIKVNPEIGVFMDLNKVVTEVMPLNEDGEIVLSGIDLIGMELNEATDKIIDEIINTGYIEVDEEADVYIDVQGDIDVEEVKKEATECLEKYFKNNGIFGKVTEDTLKKYQEVAEEYDISIGKAKMVLLASELNPEIEISELVEKEMKELVTLCHQNAKDGDYKYAWKDEYKEKIKELKEKYPQIEVIKEEIKSLSKQILDEALTDEEKAQLEEDLKKAKEELKKINEEYKTEKDKIKEEFCDIIKDKEAEFKKIKEEKASKIKEKIQKHKKYFEDNKEDIQKKVEEFQKFNEEMIDEINALKDKYGNIDSLQARIDEILEKLETIEIEEAKKLLEKEILVLKELVEKSKSDFEEEMNNLKDEYLNNKKRK